MLYYPPQYRVAPEAGAFRAQPYEPPVSAAPAREGWNASVSPSAETLAPSATQALVEGYRSRNELRKTASVLPVSFTFPAAGPSVYLVSELTAESTGPVVELSYQKEKKAGVK